MPARRGGLCCLLGGSPPALDITYDPTSNGGFPLQPIAVDLPMPDTQEELDAKFAELVDELDLDKHHREVMFNLDPEKKWRMYCQKTQEQNDPSKANWPDYYIERISAMSKATVFFGDVAEEMSLRHKLVDNLKTALRTQPMRFVTRFIELDGLQCLLDFLQNMNYETSQGPIHTSVIGCIKALMNNSQGRAHVLAHPTGINIIAQSLSTENIKTKIAVLEILGAVCLVPGGHKKALDAMIHYRDFASERTRFQTLIHDLDRNTGAYREEVNLKTAIMSFINAALKYGPGQDHLEFRIHLRYEFLMLGIQPVIEKLRKHENTMLDRHLDFFEMVRNEDEKELARRFDNQTHIDTRSASAMFELLRKKLSFSLAYPHFLSILQHCLLLPYNKNGAHYHWQLLDRIVQQVSLQHKNGHNPDAAPLDLDVNKIVRQLARESEIKEVQQKMREIQKENDELMSRLQKKENEVEVKAREKEELMSTVSNMKRKLEREVMGHGEAKQHISQLTEKLNELKTVIEMERAERQKLEHIVKTGSLPDETKMGFSSVTSSLNLTPAPIPTPPMTGGPPPPPPPPLPPGGDIPPPPPPPGVPGPPPLPGGPVSRPGLPKKNIPKPSIPLKSFNWAKLPENNIPGTIWAKIDDEKLYQCLDLEEFDQMFSAYQRQSNEENGDISMTLSRNTKQKSELTVIDGRRAQNCTILLSKLKMSNRELKECIMTMDESEELPKDMCEQLLKFVPTPEETQLLSEHEQDVDQMARADKFLLEMSKISHYGQRLKALFYKKKFTERMSEVKPKVEDVLSASKQVLRSKRLQSFLEMVLAYGNYMNRGQRGNAYGFKLSSLNKIIDTKSSINKNQTLLHYFLEYMDKNKKFTDLLSLADDIPAAKNASKVNMTELEKEMAMLKSGLNEINTEIEHHKTIGSQAYNDKFITVMSDFYTVATYNFQELEDLVAEMKEKFTKAATMFAEKDPKIQPDEFFGQLDLFFTSYVEARKENEKFRRQREEDERRAKTEAEARAERERKLANKRNIEKGRMNGRRPSEEPQQDQGEFDDLISALRTGDVFGEDMAKMKRNRGRRPSATKSDRPDRERYGPLKTAGYS